jgi:hypothetical protein
MSPVKSHVRRPAVRWFWKPAVATGAGGAATLIWWEEILLFSAEILALITIPILAGLVYLFDILAFKARQPRHDDPGPETKLDRR